MCGAAAADGGDAAAEGETVNALVLSGVRFGYGVRRIFESFSLTVRAGERLVVTGPSGCGKSTLLRLVAGFDAPEAGRIAIAGRIVAEEGRIVVPPEKRNVGMVFQDLALWPHLRVAENVGFGLRMRKVPRRERERTVAELLDLVGLRDHADRYPAELSGGEGQRVALARALATRPELLLMDEPLSSLDEALGERLCREIVRLQERFGFTLLYVTHRRNEAETVATRTVSLPET
jgi:ABC-type Fe3+/spermidine/putrescine transport system ATPase subunit